jgi:hypothetical protein
MIHRIDALSTLPAGEFPQPLSLNFLKRPAGAGDTGLSYYIILYYIVFFI